MLIARQKRTVCAASCGLLLLLLINHSSPAQSLPKVEFGTIASLTYKNGGGEASPLRVNDGDGSFLSDWVVLLGAEVSPSLSLYSEVQTANGISLVNYGLSAIYRPRNQSKVNFELGKFLVPFGTFLSRRWASENPFVGFPLAYEYQTALTAFDLPQNASELLRVRGQGQSFEYHDETQAPQLSKRFALFSGHIPRRGSGLRLLSREVYLTGAQAFGAIGPVSYHGGITNGALSNPADVNNTAGLNVLGRLTYRPTTGLQLGTSFSSGTYLDKASVRGQLTALDKKAGDFRQHALGLDASYSRGHLILFTEFILNRWQTAFIQEDLDVLAFYVEGKYTFLTRFSLAGRFSRLSFAEIDDPNDVDSDGRLREPWDYSVQQLEWSLGYRLSRNALVKLLGQVNRTLGVVGGDPSDDLVAVQTVVFF